MKILMHCHTGLPKGHDFIKFIAELGGGKGKVTRYYILQGFSTLIIKSTADALIEKHAITPEKLTEIMKWAKTGGFM